MSHREDMSSRGSAHETGLLSPVAYGGWIDPRVVTPVPGYVPKRVPQQNLQVVGVTENTTNTQVDNNIDGKIQILQSSVDMLRGHVQHMQEGVEKRMALRKLLSMQKELNILVESIHGSKVPSEFLYDRLVVNNQTGSHDTIIESVQDQQYVQQPYIQSAPQQLNKHANHKINKSVIGIQAVRSSNNIPHRDNQGTVLQHTQRNQPIIVQPYEEEYHPNHVQVGSTGLHISHEKPSIYKKEHVHHIPKQLVTKTKKMANPEHHTTHHNITNEQVWSDYNKQHKPITPPSNQHNIRTTNPPMSQRNTSLPAQINAVLERATEFTNQQNNMYQPQSMNVTSHANPLYPSSITHTTATKSSILNMDQGLYYSQSKPAVYNGNQSSIGLINQGYNYFTDQNIENPAKLNVLHAEEVAAVRNSRYKYARNNSSLGTLANGHGIIGNADVQTNVEQRFDHYMHNGGHGDAQCHGVNDKQAYSMCEDTTGSCGYNQVVKELKGVDVGSSSQVIGEYYTTSNNNNNNNSNTCKVCNKSNQDSKCNHIVSNKERNPHKTEQYQAKKELERLQQTQRQLDLQAKQKQTRPSSAAPINRATPQVRHTIRQPNNRNNNVNTHISHLQEGSYMAVDRFGKKSYIGAPLGTGDEHNKHIKKGRNKDNRPHSANIPAYSDVVKPELKSHRNNPHFRISNRLQG